MAKKITQKQLKHDEFLDAAFDFGHWLEEHWKAVLQSVVGGIVLVLAIVMWNGWSERSLDAKRQQLASAIADYEAVEADGFADVAALESVHALLEQSAAGLGGQETGKLAQFYLGTTQFHLGRLDQARSTLQELSGGSLPSETVGATARLMLARVEIAAGQEAAAVTLLERLADSADAAVPPDQALMELARIHAQAGRDDQARRQWQRIVDDYPQSLSAPQARTFLQ